jgi:hypothetical protein
MLPTLKIALDRKIMAIQKENWVASLVNTRTRDYVAVLLLRRVLTKTSKLKIKQSDLRTDLMWWLDAYAYDNKNTPICWYDLTSGSLGLINNKLREEPEGLLFLDGHRSVRIPRSIIYINPEIIESICNRIEKLLQHTTTPHHIWSRNGLISKDILLKRLINKWKDYELTHSMDSSRRNNSPIQLYASSKLILDTSWFYKERNPPPSR